MSTAYFPSAYFSYVIYGANGTSVPGPNPGANWMFDVLEEIALSLKSIFGSAPVRIFIDPNDFSVNVPYSGTTVEIGVKSLDSQPFSESTDFDFVLLTKTEIRIRTKSTDNKSEDIGLVISKTFQELTGNDFGTTCVPSRSKIIGTRMMHEGLGVYDLRFVLETQQVVTAV